MTVAQFLKQNTGSRLSYQDNWLVWDGFEWNVYSHPSYKKQTKCLYMGSSIEEALLMLQSGK